MQACTLCSTLERAEDTDMPVKKGPSRSRNPYIRLAIVIGTFATTALVGVVTGVLLAYSPDLPQISELDTYRPGTITRLHASGGELIGEFATERRVIIGYDDIPAVLRNAIISAEDGDFFEHIGFNIPRFVVTMAKNIMRGNLTRAGGSTITMQLARNVTLSTGRLGREKRWKRKLREIYYAFHIEKRYTRGIVKSCGSAIGMIRRLPSDSSPWYRVPAADHR